MAQESGGLDIKKLRSLQKGINQKAGGGDGIMLFSNKLPEELDVRLLPPPAIGNGVYYVEQEGWWIAGKFYLSNSTEHLGGGVDVIQEEIDQAKESKDPELKALVEKKKDNIPMLKKEFRYLMPILTLKSEYDDDENLVSCNVIEAKVLVAKPTLLKAINGVVTSRPFQNGTKDGIADRVKGYNIIVGKTGKGLDTEYLAMGWNEQMELDEKWYEAKSVPNVFEMTSKAGKSDAFLRSAIRNYLYGEPLLADDAAPAEDDAPAKPAGKKRPNIADAHREREDDAPKKTNLAKAAAKLKPQAESKPKGRSLLEDAEEDLNDLD